MPVFGPRVTTTYEAVTYSATKSGRCPACGRRATRSQTFMQTISPFNKNAIGELKTRLEIRDELIKQVWDWQGQPVFHAKCEH